MVMPGSEAPSGRWPTCRKHVVRPSPGRRTAGGSRHPPPIVGGPGSSSFPWSRARRGGSPRRPGVDLCPTLSPDGRFLAYASCRSDFSCAIQVLELQRDLRPKGFPRRLVELVLRVTAALTASPGLRTVGRRVLAGQPVSRSAARAPAGERILPVGQMALFRRCRARPTGSFSSVDGRPRCLEAGPRPAARALPRFVAGDQGAQFSPDGTRIAYQSGRWSRVGEILVTRADGTNPVQLTDGLGLQQGSPSVARRRWIAFDSQRPDGTFDVFVIDAAGTAAPAHRGPVNEHRPAGRGTAGGSTSPRTGPAASRSGAPRPRRASRAGDGRGGFTSHESFDGRTLYYVKERVPSQPLFARPTAAARRDESSTNPRPDVRGRGGRPLLLHTDRGREPDVPSFLEVARGRSREVARLDLPVLPGLGLTVSPTGRRSCSPPSSRTTRTCS